MKIHIVAAALPPTIDGIGDYSAQIAQKAAESASVKILTSEGSPRTPISDVTIAPIFSVERPRTVWRIAEVVAADRPDWVLLQYNPFSFGKWGLNLHLPQVMHAIQRGPGAPRVAVMFHEMYVPITSWKFALMSIWQRLQFASLGKSARALFFSIDPWVRTMSPRFPGKAIQHLPVGSNIPFLGFERQEARARLGIDEDTRVLGLFGTAHNSRLLDRVQNVLNLAVSEGYKVMLLYMGPHGQQVRDAISGVPIIAEGPLAADEISRRFAALDVYLAPFVDGVSTRRTSLMTGLQHGIPTVGTFGFNTDEGLLRQNGMALFLSDVRSPEHFSRLTSKLLGDSALATRTGEEGQRLYNRSYSWHSIVRTMLSVFLAAT